MKCPCCGFEGTDRWYGDAKEGEELFIRLSDRPFETDHKNEYWDGWHPDKYNKAYLFACPKCKNVMLGDWE